MSSANADAASGLIWRRYPESRSVSDRRRELLAGLISRLAISIKIQLS